MVSAMDKFTSPQQYFAELQSVHAQLPFAAVDALTARLGQAGAAGATIYTFGNGGSAALASHWACDFAKGTSDVLAAGQRLRVLSLVDNVALTTAWANDVAFEQIFSQQLCGVMRTGDVALAISGSGNSPNILRALEVARGQGALCLGLAGFDGGRMKDLCDILVVVPSDSMQIIEDVHVSLCHVMFLMLRRQLRTRAQALTAKGGR